MTYPEIIKLLKEEFEVKKTSKYSFCKATGINPTSVERYLCGISEPNQASLNKLADYFRVTVAYLRGEEPSVLKGKTPVNVVKHLKNAVSEKGESKVAKEIGIAQSEIHRFLLGIGRPTDETFKKLSDYFGFRSDVMGIAEFYDFYVMDKILAYVDTEIDFLIDEEVTAVDRQLIRFLLGFSKMITNLPVGLYTSSISNDELLAMDERARRFIEKFKKAADNSQNNGKKSKGMKAKKA